MILEEHLDQIFLVPADLSEELALTREGDSVVLEYTADEAGEGGIYSAVTFDNLEFTQ